MNSFNLLFLISSFYLVTLSDLSSGATILTAKAASSAAAGPFDILGGLIDSFTCRRTTNRGYKGQCVLRSCCRHSFGVAELCIDPQYTCCYGVGDLCNGGGNEFEYPYPDNDLDYDKRGNGLSGRCGGNHVRRVEWDAEPTRERTRPLYRRTEHVIVHHTGDGDRACWSFDECRRYMRNTQRHYQARKHFPDIPWNFLISENGEVFEGMGWGVEGYHTENWNDRSIGIAFIGDFEHQAPTRRAMASFVQLLECGVRSGSLDPYYAIYGHSDLRSTECPGEYLYEAIRHMKAFRQYDGRKIFGNAIDQRSAGGSTNGTLYNA